VVIALQRDRGMAVDEVEELLYRRSGLAGLSGRSSDMRELLRADDAASQLAVEHFCYWAARHAGSLAVALGGLDAVAFSGGIGAGSAQVRARIIAHLAWLGLALDAARNDAQDEELAGSGSRCAIWRIGADEEAAIARHARTVLAARQS
jgi:acetate kinase